jgi:myo-inositol-1(or 4)-monophosphatase
MHDSSMHDSSMLSPMSLLRGAERVVDAAAAQLIAMQNGPLTTTRKELRDIVTAADLASEKIVIDGLKALTPQAAILAEESGLSGAASGPRWIIDPLDGTINYAGGLPWFSVTVGYHDGEEVIVGLTKAPAVGLTARYARGVLATINDQPARVSGTRALSDAIVSVILTSHFSPDEVQRTARIIERLGSVVRGVRIIISGALEMSLVASGRFDAFVSIKADVVSHAAATPLVRAAGGRVTRLDGTDSSLDDLEKIASNGLIHDELLVCLNEALR